MKPKNEQGVVVLFGKLADELGYSLKKIGISCPDAILEKDGQTIRVEFEYKSSNFKRHKHDPENVDLIICWRDDWPLSPLPILSLEKYLVLTRGMAPRQPLWQRVLKAYYSFKHEWIQRRNSCPSCGHALHIYCETDSKGWRWRAALCPECNFSRLREY